MTTTQYAVVMDIPNDISFHPYVTSLWDSEEQATKKARRELEQFALDEGIAEPDTVIDDLNARIKRIKTDCVRVVAYVERTELNGDA